MYGLSQEDPSQIMRRIRVAEVENEELPTLPSPPGSEVNDSSYQTSMMVRKPSKAIDRIQNNGMNRRILSPLRANSNSMNAGPETASLEAGLAKVRKQQRSSVAILSPALTAPSTVSSGRTVVPAQSHWKKQPAKSAQSKEVSFEDASSGLQGNSTSLELDIPRPTPQHSHSQAKNTSVSRSDLLNSLDLVQLAGLESGYSQSEGLDIQETEAENDNGDTASPSPHALSAYERTAPPSPIVEEDEQGGDPDPPALPSPVPSTSDDNLSAVEQHIAHVVVRRRINPTFRSSGLARGRLAVSPDSEAPSPKTRPLLKNAVSPIFNDDSAFSTPGVGRRLPSSEKRMEQDGSMQLSGNHTETPYVGRFANTSSNETPSSEATSRAYPENFATPRAIGSEADLQRRKTHLLSTLRLTALRSASKSKLKRGTPFPNRRARSITPASGSDLYADGHSPKDDSAANAEDFEATTSSSTSTSSHDLTTHPRGIGNTSLPVMGAGVEGAAPNRFNGAKLNSYLHNLNTHLTKENQNLVETLAETQNEIQRLVNRSAGSSSASLRKEEENASTDRSEGERDVTREMIQGHQRTGHDIAQIREHLSGNAEKLQSTKEILMKKELASLRNQVDDRDNEITSLRDQILRRSRSGAETPQVADLQQQVFDMTDELSSARSEAASQSTELARLRQEILESASRNSAVTSDLQARMDELLLDIEERNAEVEDAQRELQEQDAGFADKMKNLEEELCKVMEEQEEQLRAAKRELETLKSGDEKEEKQDSGLDNRLQDLQRAFDDVRVEKERLEKLLSDTASDASSQSEDNRVVNLQQHIQVLQETVKQHLAEILVLKDKLDGSQRRENQAERTISSQAVQLKETSTVLAESETNLRDAQTQISRLQEQIEEAMSARMRSQQEQVNLSMALDNDLQKKYDAAQREIGNLRHQLASPSMTKAKADAKEFEIRTLKSSNHELETRVGQLKRQAMANANSTPNKGTPDKSVRFDSVNSMRTPRSASQLLGNVSHFQLLSLEF